MIMDIHIKKRMGIISISDHFFYKKEDFLFEVYQKMRFLPFDTEVRPWEPYIQVKGTSPYFEEILPGQIIPEYNVIIISTKDEPVSSIHVAKVEEVSVIDDMSFECPPKAVPYF
jgi:hypothetical protein